MKKILMVLCALILLTVVTDVFATVTCPSAIVCSRDSDKKSCKLIDDNYGYWKNPGFGPEDIQKGEYKFQRALAVFHDTAHILTQDVQCEYMNEHYARARLTNEGRSDLDLPALEAAPIEPTNWFISAWHATCSYSGINDVKLCQFNEVPFIRIDTELKRGRGASVALFVNGIAVFQKPLFYTDLRDLTAYYLQDVCGKNKECTINFVATRDNESFDIGSIVIDMQTMNFISINAVPATGFNFIKTIDTKGKLLRQITIRQTI